MQYTLDLFRIPVFENTPHPYNKMFGSLPCRQRNDASGILEYPFDEAECRKFSEQGKIIYFDDPNLFRWDIFVLLTAPLKFNSFYGRTSIITFHETQIPLSLQMFIVILSDIIYPNRYLSSLLIK